MVKNCGGAELMFNRAKQNSGKFCTFFDIPITDLILKS
jgi:hypothetical protein